LGLRGRLLLWGRGRLRLRALICRCGCFGVRALLELLGLLGELIGLGALLGRTLLPYFLERLIGRIGRAGFGLARHLLPLCGVGAKLCRLRSIRGDLLFELRGAVRILRESYERQGNQPGGDQCEQKGQLWLSKSSHG
jgi:hypothetical protein